MSQSCVISVMSIAWDHCIDDLNVHAGVVLEQCALLGNNVKSRITRWWWIRHAPVTQLQGYIYGDSDPQADVSDRALFERAAGRLPSPAHWIVTNLQRTWQTAEAIANSGYPLPVPSVEPDLREQSFGAWHGRSHAEHNRERDDEFVGVWNCPPDVCPPGGERFVDVMHRARVAIERITFDHGPGDVVCVAHGGTIRAALALALNLPAERALVFGIDNVSITRIEFMHDAPSDALRWRVREVNG